MSCGELECAGDVCLGGAVEEHRHERAVGFAQFGAALVDHGGRGRGRRRLPSQTWRMAANSARAPVPLGSHLPQPREVDHGAGAQQAIEQQQQFPAGHAVPHDQHRGERRGGEARGHVQPEPLGSSRLPQLAYRLSGPHPGLPIGIVHAKGSARRPLSLAAIV